MPKIPEVQFTAQASGPISLQHAGQGIVADGVGDNLAKLGASVTQVGNVLKDAYDQSQAASASAAAQDRLQNFSQKLLTGSEDKDGNKIPPPDFDKHAELFQKEVDSINDEFGAQLSGRALSHFTQNFTDFSNRAGLTVRKNAIDLGHAQVRENIANVMQNLGQNYVKASPLEKPMIAQAAENAAKQLVDYGIGTEHDAAALRHKFTDDTETALFDQIMAKDPEAARIAIDKGEFSKLNVEKQQVLRARAVSADAAQTARDVARETRLERQAAKKEKETQEATAKTAYDMATNKKGNTLTPEWVHGHRDEMSVEVYKWATKVAAGEDDRPSDRQVLSDFIIRASRGEDVTGESQRAMLVGLIKMDDWKTVNTLVETNSVAAKADNGGMMAKSFVEKAIQPPEHLATVADKVRTAEALQDLAVFGQNNPKATNAQWMQYARETVSHRGLIDLNELELAKRIPKFLKGDRSDVSMDALQNAYNDTKEAFKNKKISEWERDQEYLNILEYKRALQKRLETEAALKPKGK